MHTCTLPVLFPCPHSPDGAATAKRAKRQLLDDVRTAPHVKMTPTAVLIASTVSIVRFILSRCLCSAHVTFPPNSPKFLLCVVT